MVSFEKENDLIQTILVKDEAGDVCRVFIDGYITTAQDVQNVAAGAKITAVGLSSYDDTWKDDAYFPRIRVRDRADNVCEAVPEEKKTHSAGGKNKTANSFIDVNEGDYFFDAVEWAAAKASLTALKTSTRTSSCRITSNPARSSSPSCGRLPASPRLKARCPSRT
ncbi:MAG: hypothetical protein K5981_01185 [Clostridia bacterium]|nr:hypothetical protein [Clostridia bacterium]